MPYFYFLGLHFYLEKKIDMRALKGPLNLGQGPKYLGVNISITGPNGPYHRGLRPLLIGAAHQYLEQLLPAGKLVTGPCGPYFFSIEIYFSRKYLDTGIQLLGPAGPFYKRPSGLFLGALGQLHIGLLAITIRSYNRLSTHGAPCLGGRAPFHIAVAIRYCIRYRA